MEKINSITKKQIKKVAEMLDGNVQKIFKLNAKIAELEEQKNALVEENEAFNAPIVAKVGYRAEELVEKVIIPTLDENGNQKYSTPDKNGKTYALKSTKFIFKYGEEVLPPTQIVDTPESMEENIVDAESVSEPTL